ncbi:hypothetical protein C8R47DRAFT_1177278 [Mycena vitilis]|nr:hypothetical protein C8R47DRAFT_1177278 [Mycena vitilis]
MDQTIVATALPTIVEKLGGGRLYSWVGSAYLLAAAALGPLYGPGSHQVGSSQDMPILIDPVPDIFGRKPLLYSSIVIFLIGSALCGAAQNMVIVQGIGGGGILQLVRRNSDIVSLEDRGKYIGLLGATWGIASVGRWVSGTVTWRRE